MALVEISKPSGLKNPDRLLVIPVSASSVNAPFDFKRFRIELENIEIAEELTIRIEEFVIINFRVFPENPLAARLVVSLRRASLDLVAKSVLALIGIGEIRIIEHHERTRQHQPS